MHPGGEVNFRKRGSKFSQPLSYSHQTLHVPLREVKFTKGGAHSPSNIPLPLPSSTHTHACVKPLIHPWVEVKFVYPANDSRSGDKFPKKTPKKLFTVAKLYCIIQVIKPNQIKFAFESLACSGLWRFDRSLWLTGFVFFSFLLYFWYVPLLKQTFV